MSETSKILVVYTSKEGHTEEMARFVEEGARSLPETEIRRLTAADATLDDLLWAEGVACGSPTNTGILSWEMKRWWDEVAINAWSKIDGKIGCAFSSSGGIGGGTELTCMSLLLVMQNFGMLTFGIPDYVAPGFTLHYGSVVAGKPDEEREKESCRRLGRRLAEWVAVIFHARNDCHPLSSEYARFPWK
jgi:NAD(P)H dehydrogenase (quinone)